jgi:hypothetical protein
VILVAPAGRDRWFESPFPPPGTCCESAQISFQQALTSSLGLAALGNPDPDLRESVPEAAHRRRAAQRYIAWSGWLQRRYLLNQSNVLCQAAFAADSS